MEHEQIKTAQTAAHALVKADKEVSRWKQKLDFAQDNAHHYESVLLESLPGDAKVAYRVEDKAVTVIKKEGSASLIVITDLVL